MRAAPPQRQSNSSARLPQTPSAYVGFAKADRLPTKTQPKDFWARTQGVVASQRASSGPTRQVTRMMPIGVPRVPYRSQKEGGWQWVDIWNCLYRERIIFLTKPLDEELGNQLVGTMLYLDSENKKDMQLYINCAGGEVVPSLALHDTMRHIGSDVATVGFGGAMGMSGFLLAVGNKGKRYALPNTRIMMHHPSGAARGQATDIQNEARELMRVRDYVNSILSQATGKTSDRIARDFNRNCWFNTKEAQEYGLIDTVIRPARTSVLTGIEN
eukprot:CAMPEP_0177769586 /NCGR_PEP_ID=MMETSP0491_2-20121128/10410_1 /TAXON_ID=63592 /ORGANISM="Tetraselmis chuii, Strain PLY429" /LENGTH=270 /DNA_ID=CAMNT_0019286623 /DNA_START=128 /DNA_END=940 /DNA_ORIENTATION=+